MATLTPQLAAYCTDRADTRLSDSVRSRLEQHLLDWIGVVIGGAYHAESTPAVLEGLGTFGRATGERADGFATIVPSGERVAPDRAALANGTLAHSLDFDDTHRTSSLHPGAPVIAAALATAEATGASTERLRRAISGGFDVACTIAEAVNVDAHYERGFHVTATCGTFGATAAAGIVSGLTADQFENAFGINGSQVAGSLQFLENGAWNKRLHAGLAARRAVTATTLADAGFNGAVSPIEGAYGFFAGYTDDPDFDVFEDFEDREAVLETALKPYPCCRYMHAALDAILEIAPDVAVDDVESIDVALPAAGVRLTGRPLDAKRRPENFVDCQFSMPFGAALALDRRGAGFESFSTATSSLQDPGLRRLMDATSVTENSDVQALFPQQWAAEVVIETGSDRYWKFVETARGDPERPMTWAETTEKIRKLVGSGDDVAIDVQELADVVSHLDDNSVADLIACATTAGQ